MMAASTQRNPSEPMERRSSQVISSPPLSVSLSPALRPPNSPRSRPRRRCRTCASYSFRPRLAVALLLCPSSFQIPLWDEGGLRFSSKLPQPPACIARRIPRVFALTHGGPPHIGTPPREEGRLGSLGGRVQHCAARHRGRGFLLRRPPLPRPACRGVRPGWTGCTSATDSMDSSSLPKIQY
jgi:hypothetical protein